MATLQDLKSAIYVLLNHPLGVGRYQLVRRVEEKAYEAYVFGLCLRAVRELGTTQSYEEISGLLRPSFFVELLARSIRRDETTVTRNFF